MFDRRLVQHFDWGLLGLTLFLEGIGLVALYSAVTAGDQTAQEILFVRQIIWFGAGFAVMVITFLFNYKLLERFAFPIYAGSLLLLAAVLLMGTIGGGAQRWIKLGPLFIQPSEAAKISIIIVLARYYARYANPNGYSLRDLVKPALLIAVPFMLIVRQPDLGTGLLLLLIAGSMTIFVKIKRSSLVTIILFCMVAFPLVWSFLKEYQKQRILTFLNPDRDPLGAGYHIIQSKIAIGSGMFTGKGYLKGTQNALSFLPEQHTDFIFSVLAEEWGFLGAVFVLFAFFMLIVWGLRVAYRSRDPFGSILAVGVTAMLFWQIVINIGMVMGLMPVVGVPLPLISYGGSSVVTVLVCIGLLMNVSMRRFMIE
ncbi:MAG: rod shape-determining protein RodA [Desulfobacterales bacterium]|jgi:rod shape determining protein RodA|nr:rod shape-determining protein RodA [Desulfobacterales bacterium]